MSQDREEFCTKSFSDYLLCHMVPTPMDWSPVPSGQDPPDYWLKLGNVTFAVEVTRTEVWREASAGQGEVRQQTYEATHEAFIREVECAATERAILNGTYGVVFQRPITASDLRL